MRCVNDFFTDEINVDVDLDVPEKEQGTVVIICVKCRSSTKVTQQLTF